MARLTTEDRSLIKCLRMEKGWNALRMMQEFPLRKWKKSTLNDLIRKIDKTGSADRASVSGRPRSARVQENIQVVAELVCSQEGQPGTSKSPREIARETGISRSSVRRIVKKDLHLKTFRRRNVQLLSNIDKKKRVDACRRLKARMTADRISQTWFSDEKVFTVQTPVNTQNDCVYAAVAAKRDVWTPPPTP